MLCLVEERVIVLATEQPVPREEELIPNTEPGWSTVGWLDISVIIKRGGSHRCTFLGILGGEKMS